MEATRDEDGEKKDEMDDEIMFTGTGDDEKSKPCVAPRWATRVFASECLCRIILLCETTDNIHFDLAKARAMKQKNPKCKSCLVAIPSNVPRFLKITCFQIFLVPDNKTKIVHNTSDICLTGVLYNYNKTSLLLYLNCIAIKAII